MRTSNKIRFKTHGYLFEAKIKLWELKVAVDIFRGLALRLNLSLHRATFIQRPFCKINILQFELIPGTFDLRIGKGWTLDFYLGLQSKIEVKIWVAWSGVEMIKLVVVGLLIGFGNGLGSGIVMTLGADFSPEVGRAQFLGAWRVCGDLGTAGGPVIAAAATGLATLAAASVTMGVIGAIGAMLMLFLMPETLRRDPASPGPPADAGPAEA